ncbi:MAG: 16S rRNA (guanine(966)-N(2))-methyltransferase RsmD [Nocardioidaceae bacterium]|nr:MAG: 16S rRNA (guanine(966)-N(2))-methyltransferase RsmD [Nocardioidaceae bacterium]
MTRIISGTAGGRRLRTPPGDLTRPTSDRVREALFSALTSEFGSLSGLRFLDLFAGSGAVGLEALSRGAAAVTLVDSDRRAAATAAENARMLGFAQARVLQRPVAAVLASTPAAAGSLVDVEVASGAYDIAFLDPPYALADDELHELLEALVERGWLSPGALVVVERSKRSKAPDWPEGIVLDTRANYGETTLWYGRAVADPGRTQPGNGLTSGD